MRTARQPPPLVNQVGPSRKRVKLDLPPRVTQLHGCVMPTTRRDAWTILNSRRVQEAKSICGKKPVGMRQGETFESRCAMIALAAALLLTLPRNCGDSTACQPCGMTRVQRGRECIHDRNVQGDTIRHLSDVAGCAVYRIGRIERRGACRLPVRCAPWRRSASTSPCTGAGDCSLPRPGWPLPSS